MARKISWAAMPRTHPALSAFPCILEIPVQWGELDAYGHVNNAVFFRYFDQIGMIATMSDVGIGAILHSTSCRFRRSLFFPDTILVGGRATEIGADRFTMAYRVVSLGQDAVAADGEGVIVCYDYRKREKVALPDEVRAKL
jgi:acyl-CoA thioester hydrolase